MNIGETKHEFKNINKVADYEIIKTEKLHLNVSRLEAKINDTDLILGFSFYTPVVFKIAGVVFRTNEKWGTSTEKHKGQVLYGMQYDRIVDLDQSVYDFVLYQLVLRGRPFDLDALKSFVDRENIKVVRIENGPIENILDYLSKNQFFIYSYGLVDDLKSLIRLKLYNSDVIRVTTGSESVVIKNEGDQYVIPAYGTYKNLSFLNKLDLSTTFEVVESSGI
jgi:hypothetical protein